MNIEVITHNGNTVAMVNSPETLITDTQTALDFMATLGFDYHCQRIALNKKAVHEDFFDLRTGFAGEILQKFVNYGMKLAIYGDYSGYTSQSLKDFIYESNRGNHVFFIPTLEDAIALLSAV